MVPICSLALAVLYSTPTLNIPISEKGGHNSGHTHNLATSQSSEGLKLLPSATKLVAMVDYVLFDHRFQEELVCDCV